MAKPSYLNEKGGISLTPTEWASMQGDGTPENPFTVILDGTKKRIKLTGTLDTSEKKGSQNDNIVNGIIVKSKTQSPIALDTTEIIESPTDSSNTSTNKNTVNVRDKYGIGEALLNHPIYGAEIRKIFGLLDAGKLAEAEEEYFKSAWGKLDGDAQDRILMQLENDKLYKEKLKNWKIGIKRQLASRGLKADDATLDKYYLDGIDDETIFDNPYLRMAPMDRKVGGLELTTEQYADLTNRAGDQLNRVATMLAQNPGFLALSRPMQARLVQGIAEQVRKAERMRKKRHKMSADDKDFLNARRRQRNRKIKIDPLTAAFFGGMR